MVSATGPVAAVADDQVPCIDLRQDDNVVAKLIRVACLKFGFFTGNGCSGRHCPKVYGLLSIAIGLKQLQWSSNFPCPWASLQKKALYVSSEPITFIPNFSCFQDNRLASINQSNSPFQSSSFAIYIIIWLCFIRGVHMTSSFQGNCLRVLPLSMTNKLGWVSCIMLFT